MELCEKQVCRKAPARMERCKGYFCTAPNVIGDDETGGGTLVKNKNRNVRLGTVFGRIVLFGFLVVLFAGSASAAPQVDIKELTANLYKISNILLGSSFLFAFSTNVPSAAIGLLLLKILLNSASASSMPLRITWV